MAELGMAARARRGLGRSFQVSSLAPEFSALRNVMLAVQARQGSSFRFFKSGDGRQEPDRTGHGGMLERVGLAEPRRSCLPRSCRMASAASLEIAIALALGSQGFPVRRADGRYGA
jgi:branched-chain amino acid transport system ATP-binding protein